MKGITQKELRGYIKQVLESYQSEVTYIIKNTINMQLHTDGLDGHVSTTDVRNELLRMEKEGVAERVNIKPGTPFQHQIHWRLSKNEITAQG